MHRHRLLALPLSGALLTSAALALAGPAAIPTTIATTSAVRPVAATTQAGTQAGTSQTGRLRMHPQIVQPGKGTARAGRAKSAMTATFRPVRTGRIAWLQRRESDGWTRVATGRQNNRGRVDFRAPSRKAGVTASYRAVAAPTPSLARVATAAELTSRWGAPDFSDEFRRDTLGPDWSIRNRGVYAPASLRRCSKSSPQAVRVAKGSLRLSVLDDPSRGRTCGYEGNHYDWRLNGHVGTHGAQSLRYGYAAARIRMQPRRGQHAGFWMQPETREASEGSARRTGAEVDVIEWFGQSAPQGGLASFVYDFPSNGRPGVTVRKTGGYLKNPDRLGSRWSSRYHVFSVEWTPKAYVFRIDGRESYRTTKGVSGQPEYLILSLLSSDYELKHLDGEQRLPQHMKVDWVRFWER